MAMQSVKSAYVNGFVRHYQPQERINWKNNISIQARKQLPLGFVPLDGFIILSKAIFVFSPLKTFSKKDRLMLENGFLIRKDTKPDITDNLFKGLIDALAGIVFVGDQKICQMRGSIGKFYGLKPHIELEFSMADSKFVKIENSQIINVNIENLK